MFDQFVDSFDCVHSVTCSFILFIRDFGQSFGGVGLSACSTASFVMQYLSKCDCTNFKITHDQNRLKGIFGLLITLFCVDQHKVPKSLAKT